MIRIAIIADDLTGANDTGVQFCHHGLNTMVIINPDSINDFIQQGRVLSVNTNSRSMTSAEAYTTVYNIAVTLREKKVNHIYKKIDSTLRGNPGVELDALMDVWQVPLGLVVPAFPANGRIVRNGDLLIVDPNASLFEDEEQRLKKQCHIPDVLAKQMKRKVGLIELEVVRQGPEQIYRAIKSTQEKYEVLAIDAVAEKDLENIARTLRLLPEAIVAGSAGLASYMDLAWDMNAIKTRPIEKRIPESGVTIFIAGSRNSVTQEQINQLAETSKTEPVVLNPAALTDMKERKVEIERIVRKVLSSLYDSETVIITVGSDKVDSNGSVKIGTIIGETLGIVVNKLVSILKTKGLVIAGGDTALNICNALGVTGISLVVELLDGIPLGNLYGKQYIGLPVVTKAGGFGSLDAFVKIYFMFQDKDNLVEGAC